MFKSFQVKFTEDENLQWHTDPNKNTVKSIIPSDLHLKLL